MFKDIRKKYREEMQLAEARRVLTSRGYSLLLETPVANFEPSRSKDFLLDVIDNLDSHGYVDRDEIDELDEKEGYIWNQLNKIAKSFSIEKILKYLTTLGLYNPSPVLA